LPGGIWRSSADYVRVLRQRWSVMEEASMHENRGSSCNNTYLVCRILLDADACIRAGDRAVGLDLGHVPHAYHQ